MNPDDLAFHHGNGLTKREYFAAMALQGLIVWDSNMNKPEFAERIEVIARSAIQLADALIAELSK